MGDRTAHNYTDEAMRQKYILIIGLGLLSCSQGNRKTISSNDSLRSNPIYSALTLNEYEAFYNSDSNAVKAGGLVDLTIEFDCAVLIYPREEEINEMIKTYGEEDFYTIADDNNWYQAMAIEMLDSVGIKKAAVHGDSLRFRGEDKTWGLDLKNDSLSGWNVILFSRKKGPKKMSTVDLTTSQIRDYFDIKK